MLHASKSSCKNPFLSNLTGDSVMRRRRNRSNEYAKEESPHSDEFNQNGDLSKQENGTAPPQEQGGQPKKFSFADAKNLMKMAKKDG